MWENLIGGAVATTSLRPEQSDFLARHGFLLAENKSGAGGGIMAKIIEFYVPSNYHKIAKWVPAERRGQVIEFSLPKKTA